MMLIAAVEKDVTKAVSSVDLKVAMKDVAMVVQ